MTTAHRHLRRARTFAADAYGIAWFVWGALDWRIHRRWRA